MRCKNCKFWEWVLDGSKGEPWIGECRRYPPTQKQDGEIYQSVSGAPYMRVSEFEILTKDNMSCGEYQAKIPQ